MKLLFVHDHKFRKINNSFYSTGGLNDEVLSRYTNIFDEVIVFSRVIEEQNESNKYSKITNSKVTIINSLTATKDLIKELVKKTDKVIVRMPCFNGIKFLPLCRKLNRNYLIELVACPWDSFWNYDWRGKVIAPFIYLFNKIEVSKAPNVLYVTEKFLQRRYPNKNNTLACSDVVLKKNSEEVLINRKEIIEKSKPIINLGTLAAIDVKYKGQDRVIKAMGVLAKKGIYNYKYYLAGNGDKTYLLKLARKLHIDNNIIFDGGIPHEQIDDWFKKIDIYIQPSLQEGLPRSLVEAMSNALPCIGSTTGGIPELLDNQFIFSNRNSVKQIKKLLLKMTKGQMLSQAELNFQNSKKYQIDILEQKRNNFYNDFKNQSKELRSHKK